MSGAVKHGSRMVLWATLLAMSLTAALGVWQLRRAAQKRQLEQQIAEQVQRPAVGMDELSRAGSDPVMAQAILERQIRLSGRWVSGTRLFLENRPMDGQAGFIVLQAFEPAGGGPVLLVQRGWWPRAFDDRQRVPAWEDAPGAIELQGQVVPPPSRLYALGEDSTGPIRQNVDLPALAQEWSLDVYPYFSVQQSVSEPGSDNLRRHWVRTGSGVYTHYGYAAQWFALCFLIGSLYVWFQILAPRRRTRRVD